MAQVQDLHVVLETLYALQKDASFSDDQVALTVKEFLENYMEFLPGGKEDQVSDVSLLMPLRRLSEKKLRLLPAGLAACGEALATLRNVHTSMRMLFNIFESAQYVASLKNTPLAISLQQHVFSSNPVKAEVAVFDLLGNSQVVEALEVTHVKGIGKDMTFSEGQTIQGNVLDLSAEKLAPGRYHVNLKAAVKDRTSPVALQSYIVVTDAAAVSSVKFGTSKSSDPANLKVVGKARTLKEVSASADELDHVHVTYQVRGRLEDGKIRKPHQSFVRFTLIDGEEKGFAVYFLSKRGEGDSLEYSSSISLGEEVAKFNHLSGRYEVAVLVGDVTYSEPVEFVLGEVHLAFPAKPQVSHPLYAKSLLHTSDTTLKALPEIEHMMRPPARRASPFMSTVFTALTWAPLLVFIGFLLRLKPNLARLRSVSSLLYLALIIVVLVLYCGYWLSWPGCDFYSTVKYICVLIPAIVVVGRYALQSVIDVRCREVAKKEKQA